MVKKEEKTFREKKTEFRQRVMDAIYDKIPSEVVEHIGNANKEMVFAVEGVLNKVIDKIDKRIERSKTRHSKIDSGENPDDENN